MKRIPTMTYRRNLYLCCLIATTFTAGLVRYNNPRAQTKNQKTSITNRSLYDLISDRRFVSLKGDLTRLNLANQEATIKLPNEDANHAEGIFRVQELEFNFLSSSPLQVHCEGKFDVRVLDSRRNFVAKETCQQTAQQFLQDHFEWFFKSTVPVRLINDSIDENGVWFFEWQQINKDGLYSARAYSWIRSIDGRIIGFGAVKRTAPWPSHKITPDQAREIALGLAASDSDIENVRVNRVFLDSTADYPSFYDVRMFGNGRVAKVPYAGVISINALTGKPMSSRIDWTIRKPDNNHVSVSIFQDTQPAWTQNGLVLISNRSIVSSSIWDHMPPQLLIIAEGKISYLSSDMQGGPYSISTLPNSSWIALPLGGEERWGWSYILDLEKGESKVLDFPDRTGELPTISSSGRWGISSSNGAQPNSTFDLLADNLQARNKFLPALRGRLVLPGEQKQSIFSTDDKWLYFVTAISQEVAKQVHVTYSLQRIATEVLKPKGPYHVEKKQIETIIPQLPGAVERLSIFPNGEKLLAQTDKGIFAIEIATKKFVPIAPKNLQDVELDVPIGDITDGWAGPTDDRVTFSGKTTDKDGKVRRRIYSCRFDGSDLKAHTPKDNEPVPMYKFPGSDKTAYDIAKEWALNEIKWDDAHRQSH